MRDPPKIKPFTDARICKRWIGNADPTLRRADRVRIASLPGDPLGCTSDGYLGGCCPRTRLYQVAYMIGGLQFRAFYRELVDAGRMTATEFHDAVRQGVTMPVELVRARLMGLH